MSARPVQIAICDSCSGAYANAGAFVQALCDAVAIEWRRAGVVGIRILEAEVVSGSPPATSGARELKGGADGRTPDDFGLLIVTGPGQSPLDRAAVRTFLEQKKRGHERQ